MLSYMIREKELLLGFLLTGAELNTSSSCHSIASQTMMRELPSCSSVLFIKRMVQKTGQTNYYTMGQGTPRRAKTGGRTFCPTRHGTMESIIRFAGTSSTASGPPSPCGGKAARHPEGKRPRGVFWHGADGGHPRRSGRDAAAGVS